MKMKLTLIGIVVLACPLLVRGQTAGEDNPFSKAKTDIHKKLEQSVAELNALREKAADVIVPLSRNLNDLESELLKVRQDYQKTTRLLDSRTLDLSNLRSEIKSRREEATYLSNLISEYIRNFESRLHIAEIQRYRDRLEMAKLAAENQNLSQREVFQRQATLIEVSLDRLEDNLGGTRYEGKAVDDSGLVKEGTVVLIGPAAVFRSEDGASVGTIEQRLGSLEPAVIPFASSADAKAAAKLAEEGTGAFPLDPTLGNAHKIESTRQTLWEHIQKGGPVMIPILGMAAVALLVAVYKWIRLSRLGKPSQNKIQELLQAVARRDRKAAQSSARSINGPVGEMLETGVEHLQEPRELIEEVMYEKVLSTRLKLQRLLPFIAISASSAPLLGLLGTVTGIINTFKLITVFGSGDVKMLSGGISEALITTEFGLIVAIPSLLLHAFLSRKARGISDQMEKAAISLVNQVGKTPFTEEQQEPDEAGPGSAEPDAEEQIDSAEEDVPAVAVGVENETPE